MDGRGGGSRREVERLRQRADNRHARGHRPRLGPDGRRLQRSPQRVLKEQYQRSRNRGRTSSPCISWPIRSSSELGLISPERSCGDRALRVRGATRATRWCNCGASAKARNRRGPHAQPADDRRLADGATEGDRRPAARRQDVLRHDRRRPRSARAWATARRSAADQERGRLRGGEALFETYGIHFDPALRDEVVARVDGSSCPPTPDSYAPARGRAQRRRVDHECQNFVSERSDPADARLSGKR